MNPESISGMTPARARTFERRMARLARTRGYIAQHMHPNRHITRALTKIKRDGALSRARRVQAVERLLHIDALTAKSILEDVPMTQHVSRTIFLERYLDATAHEQARIEAGRIYCGGRTQKKLETLGS